MEPDLSAEQMLRNIIHQYVVQLDNKRPMDVIIGVPFQGQKESVNAIVASIIEGLKRYYSGLNAAIVCAGTGDDEEIIKSIKSISSGNGIEIMPILMPSEISGKGWCVRAIMEIARNHRADVLMFEDDLMRPAKQNATAELHPEWIQMMLEPIRRHGYDIAIASFQRNYPDNAISFYIAKPIIAALYGCDIDDPISGVWAAAYDVVDELAQQIEDQWSVQAAGYGIDIMVACSFARYNNNICCVKLGSRPDKPSLYKNDAILQDIVITLFERIKQDEDIWKTPHCFIKHPDTYGLIEAQWRVEPAAKSQDILETFRSNFSRFHNLWPHILPEKLREQVERLSISESANFTWDEDLWARVTYDIMLAYQRGGMLSPEEVVLAYIVLYNGYLANRLQQLEAIITPSHLEIAGMIAERSKQAQASAFIRYRDEFIRGWKQVQAKKLPLLPRINYMEFIPNMPIVLPHEIRYKQNRIANTITIYQSLLRTFADDFNHWVYGRLNIPQNADAKQIGKGISDFMAQVEAELPAFINGDLYDTDALQSFMDSILAVFPHDKVLTLKNSTIRQLMELYPPVNLMVARGYDTVAELLDAMDPADALALSSLTDEQLFEPISEWIKQNARPENFVPSDIKMIAVNPDECPSLKYTFANKLTGHILACRLPKGVGGRLPKLRYFTRLAKHIIELMHWSYVWSCFADERRKFGKKLINSITAPRGKDLLSAYNIMEDWHQADVASGIKAIAGKMKDDKISDLLDCMADGYRLGMTLPNGTFMPCSAWTWSSYSFKGGKAIPSSMALHVERDAFTHRLLLEICRALNIESSSIIQRITELAGRGETYEDISKLLFNIETQPEPNIALSHKLTSVPPAAPLKRYEHNPILEPIADSEWESRYTLNAGALRIKDKVYLIYRAVGADGISRLGLAITDGFKVLERLPQPVFAPVLEEEQRGCEDPRLTIIGERVYMTYTAYDGVIAQIAVASISVDDFIAGRFNAWQRHGMAFPRFIDKDAIIFPEKNERGYAIYHRTEPSIWVSYAPTPHCPWPREGHRIVAGPRSGLMWDARKVGAGAPPIKTKYGWLLIYHGIDMYLVYRLGVLLVDLNDPSLVLYRSPNPVLSPETSYEVGEIGKSWVPNVVFTCGAVPMEDKEILDEDDEIIVYYGAADTVLCAATGRVGALIGRG